MEEVMDTVRIKEELTALATAPGSTPSKVREAARDRLGRDIEHPLIVLAPNGPAMRIYSQQGTIWVPVPSSWASKWL